MNKRIFKRIISLVLIVVMAVSTMMVSAVSTSAETSIVESELNLNGNTMYYLDFTTAGSDGTSKDDILIKINGTNGSTDWHNVSTVAKNKTGSMVFFSKKDVGTIKSITVKNSGSDGWYPEIINCTKQTDRETIAQNLYGGRWVDDGKEVTISVTDRVAKVTVQTDCVVLSGTDSTVYINLIDDKGNKSGKNNLSSIHPKANAFERYDKATFYIHLPENFGELNEIQVNLDGSQESWGLAYIDVLLDSEIKIFPCNAYVTDKLTTLKTTGYLYKVTVKTGDKLFAGTDSNILLYIYDKNGMPIKCKGKSENWFLLENEDNNFERNAKEYFYIASPEKIADIKMVCNDLRGTNWHVEYVQLDLIYDDTILESTKYNYNQWIDCLKEIAPTSKKVLL